MRWQINSFVRHVRCRTTSLKDRATTRDRRHYLVQARGSLYELETQLEILKRARLAKDESGVHDKIAAVEAGLTRMIESLSLRL